MDMDIDNKKSAEKPKLNAAQLSLVAEGNSRICARANLESIAQSDMPSRGTLHFTITFEQSASRRDAVAFKTRQHYNVSNRPMRALSQFFCVSPMMMGPEEVPYEVVQSQLVFCSACIGLSDRCRSVADSVKRSVRILGRGQIYACRALQGGAYG
jgi:hypothetical protein